MFAPRHIKIDLLILYSILKDEANKELLLCASYMGEQDKTFSERKRVGSFNILIQRRLIDNETKFRSYFKMSFELFNYIKGVKSRPFSNRVKKPISLEEKLSLIL